VDRARKTGYNCQLVKTETDNPNCGGGWVLAAATLAVGVLLFMPVHRGPLLDLPSEWLAPSNLSALLGLGLAAAGFWAFRRRFWARGAHTARKLRSGVVLVVMQAILFRSVLEIGRRAEAHSWAWLPVEAWLWTPWFLTTGFAAMLLGSRLGVFISVSGVFLLYLTGDPGPLVLTGCLVSLLSGILMLRRPTRSRVLRAGAVSGALLGAVALVHGLLGSAPAMTILAAFTGPILVGLLSAFLVLAFLPVMEWVLGELSDVSLVEYGSEHPLLDELKEQAPGTWIHTLNVSDLAEKAAAAIGARSLFCRTAALYHDVGKLKAPGFFAENITGPSPHEGLDPQASAGRIIDHVVYGLELARKHRLPKAFREIISEHHGSSIVRFFYAKACAQLREGEDAERIRPLFRYPGPPPSSCESGIIALADIVEAATRSLNAQSESEARAFVRKLIADRMAEGELAQCPLTLAELALAEETFVHWVKARHHNRPAYPKAPVVLAEKTSEWAKDQGAAQPA
jgi:putative nucleotidyltransferase with HDIG domain